MTQHSGGLSGFLHGFKRLIEPPPPAPDAPAHGADEWQPLIQQTKNLEVALQQLRHRTAAFSAATSASQQSAEKSPAEAQQTLEAVHQQVGDEILALHAQLQTHLFLEEIQQAQALMRELDAVVRGAGGGDLEQRIRAAVIQRLVRECAPLAWQTLLTLLERAQVAWPEPTGLPPHADAQAVQAARKWELAQVEEAFLSSSLGRAANRALGVVESWEAHYPSPDSRPWRLVVLQGVGYGILGSLLGVAVAKLQGGSADFRARVEHVLHEELATLQQVMQAGVHSAADADVLIASVTQLCQEVVPTMAWETAAPDVRQALQRFTG
jgi:hypothetical protein